jgi:phosphatidate cytidylyltransferase
MALPGRKIAGAILAVTGALFPLLFVWHSGSHLLAALTVATLGSALFFLFRVNEIKASASEFALTVSGFLYVPLLLGHLILTRELPHGIQWIFLLLVLVMTGDSGAYYVGSSLGRHKLYPLVSPNKSMEGAAGGLAGSLFGAFCARWLFFPELSAGDCFLAALIIGPLGQLGDLFESLLKRSFGVKDSGTIIPGHGGMLDRLDSILFASPALYYYAVLRGIP